MSGDVQPQKRRHKNRKREEDESSHGVHITKMGNEDMHLHVHHEHGTGGHWCAKLVFFVLTAILAVLIGLIMIEQRGLAELDNHSVKESRYASYFDGWVEEHAEHGDEHDPVQASIEEHEEHDEPFEEDEEAAVESTEGGDADSTENEPLDETGEIEDEDEEVLVSAQVDEDEDDAAEQHDADDEDIEGAGGADNSVEPEQEEEAEEEIAAPAYASHKQYVALEDNDADDDDDDDDDEAFGLESIVDNDGEELLLLQRKARELGIADDDDEVAQKSALNAAEADDGGTKEEDEGEEEEAAQGARSPSLTFKLCIGVALVVVARLVIIRKNPNTTMPVEETSAAEIVDESLLQRRLTIPTVEQLASHVPAELPSDLEDDYSEEEIEIEEEIEYDDEYEDEDADEYDIDAEEDVDEDAVEDENIESFGGSLENNLELSVAGNYVPDTFEQLNAMYRNAAALEPANAGYDYDHEASTDDGDISDDFYDDDEELLRRMEAKYGRLSDLEDMHDEEHEDFARQH